MSANVMMNHHNSLLIGLMSLKESKFLQSYDVVSSLFNSRLIPLSYR